MDRSIRKIVIIIGLFVVFISKVQHAQELFQQGNNAYKHHQWHEALACYKSIDKKGSAVWYNMGNCFYKIGDIVQAVLCWKRAQRNNSRAGQSAALKNLAIAYKKFGYKIEDSLSTRSEQWAYVFPLFPLQLLFLLCWYACWVICCIGVRSRPLLWYGFLVSLCMLILPVGNLLLTHYYMQRYPKVLVIQATLLFAGPHERYHQLGTVHVYDELWVEEQRVGWYKVAQEDRYGWISSAATELI